MGKKRRDAVHAKDCCEKCGKAYDLSFGDVTMRKLVAVNARLFPLIAAACDRARNYCNECWKAEINPAAKGLLGSMEKEESGQGAAENAGSDKS